MRLLIVSHVVHYRHQGQVHAYSPYAKEIEIWADLFPEVVIAAPCHDEEPPQDACPIARPNIRVAPQREVGGNGFRDKAGIVAALPALIAGLSGEMRKADAIHVRCPGNLGLLGAMLAPLFSRRLIAKYAGQWNGFPGEEWTVRLQRSILRSRWWRGPVTVYGKRPGEPDHVVNFFSTMFTSEQLSRASNHASANRLNSRPTIAFSGRLTKPKNVDVLLRAIATLKTEGVLVNGLIMGDGPERDSLRTLAGQLGITGEVEFTGAVPPESIPDFLERSDIFVLASNSEGWPKSIAEAMAFGLVCIGSDLGLIRTFLADGRGLTVPPADVAALTDAIRKVATSPEQYAAMRQGAAVWAQRYSLEGLREALRAVITESWKLPKGRLLACNEASQTQ